MINKQFISAFLSTVMAVSILCTPLTSIHAYAVEETSDIVAEDSEVIEPGEEVEDFRDDGEVEDNLETTVSEDTEDTEIQENAAVDGTESDSALEEEIEAEEQAERVVIASDIPRIQKNLMRTSIIFNSQNRE